MLVRRAGRPTLVPRAVLLRGTECDGAPGLSSPPDSGLTVSPESAGWSRFADAASAAVHHLARSWPLPLWLLTRVDCSRQLVVSATGAWSSDLSADTALPWLDSFGLHMSSGKAPGIAPRVAEVPLYAAAAAGRFDRVRACLGTPILLGEDEVFGTLCGFSSRTADPHVTGALPELLMLGRMLSTIVTAHAGRDGSLSQLEAAQALADTDALTGLANRRGWLAGLEHEARRTTRYGALAGVIALDLDGLKTVNDRLGHSAGDALLQTAAATLQRLCRPSDLVARPGGDEFAVLAVHTGVGSLDTLVLRLRAGMRAAGVPASVAGAAPLPAEALTATWARADSAMYAEKRRRQNATNHGS